jgi:glutathione S-transferase
MASMTLIQIPFSHNCVKIRVALAIKGVAYETQDVPPGNRAAVVAASGQGLVPVLVHDGRTIADSTRILLYLEERYPDPLLIPLDPEARAECLLLEDWADHAFMAISRRLAYGTILRHPGRLAALFFPGDRGPARWIKERIAKRKVTERFGLSAKRHKADVVEAKRLAALAIARLGGRPWLLGASPTIADIALATMSAPLITDPDLRQDPHVGALLSWGEALVPPDVLAGYRG